MFTRRFKKYLSIGLVLLIVFVRLGGPVSILAQEADPTPTPTPTEEVTPTPTPDSTVLVEEPTPTPTPTDTAVEATNSAELNNNVDSGANTGENTATQSGELDPASVSSSSGSDPEASGSAAVDTGDAAVVTLVENQVNTTVVNSTVYHHTLNLFINENGDLDLSDPSTIEIIAENIVSDNENSQETVNILATDTQNYAYLSNDVVSIANTGANTIEGSMEATINTGNAISVVSLLNQVNFTIEGSTLHFVTINIFGKLTGNIILPEFSTLESCNECGMSVNAENQATVNNNVNSQANTGENAIVYEDNGSITTGDAASVVNLTNWINTNIIGLLIFNLVINVFGEWNGQFLGWGDIPAGNGSIFSFISSGGGSGECCGSQDLSISNQAYVNNNISSSANTGGNSINAQNASINTGRAISIVSLANFVNTNFINSIGFFGFLNIFGEWNGNIGGASKFITPTPAPESEEEEASIDAFDGSREDGGQLAVSVASNVGTYVNPGDTVTFFVDVNNPGTGKTYETKLYLYLVYDNENVGGTVFDLGAIGAGKKVKVTTGFVLSNDAPEGAYIGTAVVKGTTGEKDRKNLISSAQTNFDVGQSLAAPLTVDPEAKDAPPAVLGAKNIDQGVASSAQDRFLLYLFLLFSSSYLGIRIVKKREYLAELFTKGLTFKERVYSFRLFLL